MATNPIGKDTKTIGINMQKDMANDIATWLRRAKNVVAFQSSVWSRERTRRMDAAKRKPVTLAYLEEHPSKEKATSREIQIKKWSRAKKQALIDGDIVQLHEPAKRRT